MRLGRFIFAGVLAIGMHGPVQAEPCNPNDPQLVKPDLQSLTPLRVRVVQRGGYRRLYFTSKVANLGRGPLEIHGNTVNTPFGPVTKATQKVRRSSGAPCDVDVGTFEFHASHNHFHLNDFAEYQLRKDDPYTGEIVARASKISFCLTDIEPLRGFDGQRQVDANCAVQEGVQGISSGWADVYDDFYPEQYIELDICRTDGGVPPGGYWLVNVADPDNLLLEDNEDFVSNSGVVSVSIPGRVEGQPVPTCPGGGPAPTTTPVPQNTTAPPPNTPIRGTPTPTRFVPTATPPATATSRRPPRFRPTRVPRIRPTRVPKPPKPTRVPRIPPTRVPR